ncbi:MAG: T9SS type A sorting domain-containing protein [Candidatus Eisenbacteria bacterium]|nr:T9SS type A sorting domain-containing protein [Candidatus Eisenbacteria bacterium]
MSRKVFFFLAIALLLPAALPAAWADDGEGVDPFRRAEMERRLLAAVRQADTPAKVPAHESVYDVLSYRIDVRLDPSDSTVVGEVVLSALSLTDTLDRIDLDLSDSMTVDSVAGAAVAFSHAGDLLALDLDRTYLSGETFETRVLYHGTPRNIGWKGLYWQANGTDPVVASMDEPFFSHYWWPCKDVPWDKADSSEVILTVPEPMTGVSNGILLDVDSLSESGWRSFRWKTRHPLPPYLIFVAAAEYERIDDVYEYGYDDSMPISHYVWPIHRDAAAVTFELLPQMLGVLENVYGPYPFRDERYGHAVIYGLGAMEHNTCTSFGDRLVVNNHSTDNVVVHELGHQWWGDLVTCADWNHLWLNEGFATYTETIWFEHLYGSSILPNRMAREEYHGSQSVYIDSIPDEDGIFDGRYVPAIYGKGSWVLHMLRHKTGWAGFLGILQRHRNDSVARGGYADTEQFRASCEAETGLDLERFFRQWVYLSGSPSFRALPFVKPGADSLWILLAQDPQQDTCFAADLEITALLEDGTDTLLTAPIGNWVDTLRLDAGGPVAGVLFDEENWLLDDGFTTPLDTALALEGDGGRALLRWAVEDSFYSGVRLYRGDSAEGPWTILAGGTQPLDLEGSYDDGVPTGGAAYYAIRAVSDSLPGWVSTPSNVVEIATPTQTELVFGTEESPASPNPFILGAPYVFRFNLARSGPVTVRVYDVSGRLVRTLHDGSMQSGFAHEVAWDGTNGGGRTVAPGVYLIRFESGNITLTRKVVALR